jgi:hypothetical protein
MLSNNEVSLVVRFVGSGYLQMSENKSPRELCQVYMQKKLVTSLSLIAG